YCLILDQGEISPPVETNLGYHIIRVTGKEKGKIRDLQEAKADIESMLNKTVDDLEIAKYYSENLEQFQEEEKVRIRHILVRDEETAKKVRRLLLEGQDFAETARQFSIEAAKDRGGDLGFVTRGKLTGELEETAFGLEPGKFSEIIKSSYGFHLIKVEEKVAARTVPLEEKRNEIRETLIRPRKEKAFRLWMKEQRNNSSIKINGGKVIKYFKKV
ncbi:MAG: peptidyl-prolyl cis-trans isomerase, partial [Candidatus Wallbacteria bacterium]|nr:peptidyl-prolyl cis-trans isomerase [Candidatus Wallbacteria bacterium]